MNERITQILAQMAALEDDLRAAVQEQEVKMFFTIKGKRVEFESSVKAAHRKLKKNFFRWLVTNRPQNLITGPIIYGMVFPLMLLDLCVSFYQWACFPIYGIAKVRRGDYIVFAFAGEAQASYPGLRAQPFFKQVRGLPGDVVTVEGRAVAVNGEVVGLAKTHAFDKRPLEPMAATVIPPGHYYVQGTGHDSFDSRYRSSGLVRADQVIATVVPLF